jgi:hypothetical protein
VTAPGYAAGVLRAPLRRAISAFDAALAEFAATARVVIGAIAGDSVRAPTRPADLAAHRRHSIDERDQLGAVVAVAAGERPGERDPTGLDQEVVLGAGSGSINRARACRGAPFFACTWLASSTARDHSISPAARKRASSTSCSRSHTPAFCHFIQAAPAGHLGAEAKLDRQMRPRDPRVQHKQDPLQRLPIRQPLAARVAKAPLHLRQQRLDQLPQLVRDDPRRNGHRHPPQLDDACRRRSSSAGGSLPHHERSS